MRIDRDGGDGYVRTSGKFTVSSACLKMAEGFCFRPLCLGASCLDSKIDKYVKQIYDRPSFYGP